MLIHYALLRTKWTFPLTAHRHNLHSVLTPALAHRSSPQDSSSQSIARALDVVLPILHGPNGEDGSIQGFLQLANVPYVGCDVLSSALGMDKIVQKKLFSHAGLPIVDFLAVARRQWRSQPKESLEEIEASLSYPLFVKPAALGSSVGISKVHNRDELGPALDTAARYDRRIIVEAAVPMPGKSNSPCLAIMRRSSPCRAKSWRPRIL